MIEIRLSALEAFLYFTSFILVIFGLGYVNALIDRTKGFSREEANKIEKQAKKIVGEVKNDTDDRIPHDSIQLGPAIPPKGKTG